MKTKITRVFDRKKVGLIFFLLLLHLIALAILGGGRSPDTAFELVHHLATVLIFGIWVISIIGWGFWIVHLLQIENPSSSLTLAVGTAFYTLLAVAFSHLGWIGSNFNPLFYCILYIGLFFFTYYLKFRKLKSTLFIIKAPTERTGSYLVFLAIGIVIFLRIIKAQIPWDQSDPLFYQLLTPRLWSDFGSVYFPSESPVTFQASYWEYLHVWAFRLLSGLAGRGLIEVQIFAQLTHVVLGYSACGLAVYHLCRKNFKLSIFQSAASTFCALSTRELLWAATLAKNDWGGSFWTIVGLSYLPVFNAQSSTNQKSEVKLFGLSSILLGMAVAAKFTQAVFIGTALVFTLFLFFTRKSHLKKMEQSGKALKILIFGFLFLIALFPYLFRNYFYTGNPLFPYFGHLFKGTIPENPGFRVLLDFYEKSEFQNSIFDTIIQTIFFFFQTNWVLFPIPLFLIFGCRLKFRPHWFFTYLVTVISFFLFSLTGARVEFRHLGCIVILLSSLAPLCFQLLVDQIGLLKKTKAWPIALFLVAVFLQTDVVRKGPNGDLPLTKQWALFWSGPPAHEYIRRTHAGGLVKTWMRLNAPPNSRAVIIGDLQFYYLPLLHVSSFETSVEFAEIVQSNISIEQLLTQLHSKFGYHYLLDIKSVQKRAELSHFLTPIVEKNPCILLFQAKGDRVIDLEVMHRVLETGTCKI